MPDSQRLLTELSSCGKGTAFPPCRKNAKMGKAPIRRNCDNSQPQALQAHVLNGAFGTAEARALPQPKTPFVLRPTTDDQQPTTL